MFDFFNKTLMKHDLVLWDNLLRKSETVENQEDFNLAQKKFENWPLTECILVCVYSKGGRDGKKVLPLPLWC